MLPDLLEPTPRARLDLGRIERAMDFAFASAGTYTELDDCLDRVEHPRTTWDPASFERSLFLKELLASSFTITIDGKRFSPSPVHLAALVSRPPADPAIVRCRQAVLAELVDRPELRRELGRAYVQLRRFKELLGPKDAAELPAPERRRMEVLSVAFSLVESLRTGFVSAKSALSRLTEAGEAMASTPEFERLRALLALEKNLATIDARLRIGRDGSLRALAIERVTENDENPLYEPPLSRFWQRVRRFFRGYVLREEELRDAVVDAVFAGVRPALAPLFQLQGDMETYLAALGFRDAVRARGLDVCIPEIAHEGDLPVPRELVRLFNPHLLTEPKAPVPCSITFARHDAIAIFTGPNSGGKTRLLQALALAQLLGQAGLFVPAERASLTAAPCMFVSLIEEARHDQKEGRLGTELLRIREVFERLGRGGVVLLDELCSGTNPSEGEEIFELVTTLLADLEPQAYITTHFLDFAARLSAKAEDDRLVFFRVGLDEHDEPTFQFEPGVARSSLAKKTAARLGVTRETLMALVAKGRAGKTT